jgi:hypothetical protein
MRRLPPSFDATVSAFRDMTAIPAEGSATRARVLVRAGRDARRRSLLRRSVMPLVIALAILFFGAALTAAGFRWRAPAPVGLTSANEEARIVSAPGRAARPVRVVPPLWARTPEPPAAQRDREPLAYDRAHRAHFFSDAPALALAAWDEYLAAYPRGTFAPEARYNRALCLVRLGKFGAAAEALRPFARGGRGTYRRQEACLLMRWLSEKAAAIDPERECATEN